jgi:hypothetical protein
MPARVSGSSRKIALLHGRTITFSGSLNPCLAILSEELQRTVLVLSRVAGTAIAKTGI